MAVVMEAGGGGDFPARLTFQVLICTIIAAFGGLMFGYDIGISGGVTGMDDFLEKFFPKVLIKKHSAKEDNYCKFNDQILQLFTSSLYLAAILCSGVASFVCARFGRKPTMQCASVFFLIGVALNFFAKDLIMLIVGRIFLGAGVGFGNQAVPLFISEIAPPKYRGGLNICFQLLITIGILIANIVNYFTAKIHPNGWRISLGGAAGPALFLLLGSLIISETPTSLIARGKNEKGKNVLKKIRGVENVDKEYEEICAAIEIAKQVENPWGKLMSKSNRPMLFCGTIIQVFQQFTGINAVMFYAPVLFQTMGLGSDGALLSAVVTDTLNVICTFVAVMCVDKVGRRFLLLESAGQMFVAQIGIGCVLMEFLKATNTIPKPAAISVLVLILVFVSGFAWSWGPLGWLIPSEIFPIETRSQGFFFAVSMNMLGTFLIAQTTLSMLCTMKAGIFFFFAAWILVMGLFAKFILPETKGVPIDEMNERVWSKHWLWKKCYGKDN